MHRPLHAPERRKPGRTSRPEPPANGPHRHRSGCSGKQYHPPCRLPRERQPEDHTTDAMGTAVLETRFRGRSQALLYNEVHPHSSIGYLTPNEFVAQHANAAPRQATGRVAAVCGPSRPGRCRTRPVRDKCSKQGTPSQAKPWSEKTGQVTPARCRTRPVRDKCSKPGTPSQANRGPKKQGRSRVPAPDA
jgi:hypothetical protein